MPRFDDDDDDDRPKPRRAPPKAAPRRSALKLVGLGVAGVAVAGLAGIGARGYQTGALGDLNRGIAFDPWRSWDKVIATPPPLPPKVEAKDGVLPEEPPIDAAGVLNAGILAASPHNTQPWRFRATGNVISLVVDETRWMRTIDPERREMLMGIGCCLENILIGARAAGIAPIHNTFPQGPNGPEIARLTLYRAPQDVSTEARAIGRRRTNRGPYIAGRAIETATLDQFEGLAPSGNVRIAWIDPLATPGVAFSNATQAATESFVADAEMLAESNRWFRHDLATIDRLKDGLTTMTGGTSHVLLRSGLMMPPSRVGDPHTFWIQLTRTVQLPTAARFGAILIPDGAGPPAFVDAGRLWQRMHIKATILGIAAQPLNQTIEVATRDRAVGRPSAAADGLKAAFGRSGWQTVFAFRMGYSNYRSFMSPRRPATDVLDRT